MGRRLFDEYADEGVFASRQVVPHIVAEAGAKFSHAYSSTSLTARLALVRIGTHYFSHSAWLEEGILLRDAGRLAGIPGVLIHGRHDLSGPVRTAWELARAWPDAELVPVTDSGHTGSDTMRAQINGALTEFAGQ